MHYVGWRVDSVTCSRTNQSHHSALFDVDDSLVSGDVFRKERA